MIEGYFAVVPIEVAQDKRLTLEQTRVLIALFSFRNKVTNTVWPSRASIAERTGMHVSNISAATSALAALGWLKKVGSGGYSKSCRYTLCSPFETPETVADSATVAQQTTVAQSATPTVAESARGRVAESARGKELTKEHTKEHTNARAAALGLDGVSDSLLADWETVRKAKRAGPVTATAAAGLLREAKKAGYTAAQAIEACCANGWQGFRAEWVIADKQKASGQRGAAPEHKHAAAMAAILED